MISDNQLSKFRIIIRILSDNIDKRSSSLIKAMGYCHELSINWDRTIENMSEYDSDFYLLFTSDEWDGSCYFNKGYGQCNCLYGNPHSLSIPIRYFLYNDKEFEDALRSELLYNKEQREKIDDDRKLKDEAANRLLLEKNLKEYSRLKEKLGLLLNKWGIGEARSCDFCTVESTVGFCYAPPIEIKGV